MPDSNPKIVVVMPAYYAEKTLEKTFKDLPKNLISEIILVDDASGDRTAIEAKKLGIKTFVHKQNVGYGGNQKTCYWEAQKSNADIIIMLHPDYQYDPRLVTAMAAMISSGVYDMVIGSRILGGQAVKSGMPLWKYISNRALTVVENILLGAKLSEYHTGYRAYSKELLTSIRWQQNSNDFQFDNEFLAQVILENMRLGEISVPTKYFPEASSINFIRSVKYGLAVLGVSGLGLLARFGIYRHRLFRHDC